MPELGGRRFPLPDQLGELAAFLSRKTHDVLLIHSLLRLRVRSCLRRHNNLLTYNNNADKVLAASPRMACRYGDSRPARRTHLRPSPAVVLLYPSAARMLQQDDPHRLGHNLFAEAPLQRRLESSQERITNCNILYLYLSILSAILDLLRIPASRHDLCG
jgi:hypothetical protein